MIVHSMKWWHACPGAEEVPGLHPVARELVERCLDELEDEELVPAIMRYGRACDLEIRAREAWVERGCPVMLEQPNGMVGAHPLLRTMQATARHASDMHKACGLGINGAAYRRPPGRPVGAVSAPDRKLAPPRLTPVRDLGPKLQTVYPSPEKGA